MLAGGSCPPLCPTAYVLCIFAIQTISHAATVEGLAQRREMRSVGAAFTIGAVGSVVGAVMAFYAATHIGPAAFRLPVTTAAQVAGAIVATYIGGSANLFAGE
jgi:Protein of unknown function (DUF819)